MENLPKNKILRTILQLSWPILIANNVVNAAALFDMFLVGKLGVSQLAAISISSIILSVYLTMQGGMMSGAIAVVSRFLGGKRHEELSQAVVQMILFSFTAASVFSIFLFIFMNDVLVFFGAKGETLASASGYLPVMLISVVFMSIFSMINAIIRGSGDSVTPLKLMSAASLINIILDPFLIFGIGFFPAMGLKGAAIANLSGFAAVNFIAVSLLLRGRLRIKIRARDLKFNLSMMTRFVKIVVPAMGQGLLDKINYMILLKIVAVYGDPFIAAFGIINNLTMFMQRFGWPIGNSGGVIVGHSLGGGNRENVRHTVKTTLALYTSVTASFAAVFFVFTGWVIGIFTADSAVIGYGSQFLHILAPAYILMGAGVIMFTTFNSAGATGLPLAVNFTAFYLIQIPLALILPRFIGESGIYWAMTAGMSAHGIISLLFLKFSNWMDKKI